MKTLVRFLIFSVMIFVSFSSVKSAPIDDSKNQEVPKAKLGQALFFETSLSNPVGQSCASCHSPSRAFSSPDFGFPTSEGAIHGRYGSRNAPPIMYASFVPPFGKYPDSTGRLFLGGGLFWDGRAATLEEQAKGPLLNALEMNNPDEKSIVQKVMALYQKEFDAIYGMDSLSDPSTALDRIVEAIASFERTSMFHPFSSKFDAYFDHRASLTEQELRGLQLFDDPKKANCAVCHTSQSAPDGTKPLFTNFTYDNVGVPKNPVNPFYKMSVSFNPEGVAYIDLGLTNNTGNIYHKGGFRIPSLRNIALTAPYMHNGYFQTLRGVVEFYNSRDTRPACANPMTSEVDALRIGCWPAAEVDSAIDHQKSGKLGLTTEEVDDVVAFLNTLTDNWSP